ncbi:MAG: ABC transporter substrate-binding protein [Bradyrhizobiaceae bacterium]|nr:ABC transporter substrate-binding protein [Bradyrhizobiaceae bacterium]
MNTRMRLLFLGALLAAATATTAGNAQDTIKVGVILPFSGTLSDTATQMDGGIKLYQKLHGDRVAGKKIELVRRDTGGIAPDVAKRLAQELIVREGVDVLTGFVLTPNALAAADVSSQAKKPLVIMNAATSIITTKSPYSVRVSMTLPQINAPFGQWAAKQGIKSVYTLVADYGPGHDAEQAFIKTFKAAGGEVLGSIRMPVATIDFSAFVQKASDSGAQSVFIFIPAGPQPAAIMKNLVDRGITPDKFKILGSGELTDDSALKGAGNAAVGVLTAYHYDHTHKSALNDKFVKAFRQDHNGENPNLLAVGGYDGMHLIYEALKKTGGKTDAESFIAAAKGMKWESPRGFIEIDPETRDIVQTIYIRRVEKVDGRIQNVEIDKVDNVKDPVKEEMKKKN